MYKVLFFSLLIPLFIGCKESYRETFRSVAIDDVAVEYTDLTAYVNDPDGNPLPNVSVSLKYQNVSTLSDSNGSFSFSNIIIKNDILILKKDTYYDGVYTYSPADDQVLTPFILTPKTDSTVRLLFTGDLSFARRFMDTRSPDRTVKLITQDVPDAILKVSNLRGSGQNLITAVKPLFESVDFPTVNFESIATRYDQTLAQIHPTKDFAYYSDSLSLGLLKDLNVSFVTLGNNHVYDYSAAGLRDTMNALDANQISHSGAGITVDDAFTPYQTQIKGKPFSFIGATSIRGDKHEVLYVAHEQNISATDPFLTQGGAADAHDKQKIATVLQGEKDAGYFPIYQFHGGIEYTHAPNSVALRLLNEAIDNKASLVISHHPHTPQGYGMKNGVLMAYGMGNFIFDQDRLDTMLSHILVCDVNETDIRHAVGYPIYIKDYIPKLLTGDLANRFIKHISEASRNGSALQETPYENDFMLFPYQHKEFLSLDNTYTEETKTVILDVNISQEGYETVDLRHILPSEYSLSGIDTSSSGLTITMGRDLLWFGSFEDNDIDEKFYENSIWNFGRSVASSSTAYRGKASAHLFRDESNLNNALLYFGRRIRTIGDARNHPNKNLSFFGYFKGINSQPFSVESPYYASIAEETFGSTMLLESPGGNFDWQKIEKAIPMPEDKVISSDPTTYLSKNARALKLFIRMDRPQRGSAHLYVDDLAVINWEEAYTTDASINLSTPHAREFLKVTGTPGTHTLQLRLSRYLP